MAIDTISTLPEIPTLGDPNFSSKMFALASALKAMVPELNTSNGQVDAVKLLIDSAKTAAETAASSADSSATDAAQAVLDAADQVTLASSQVSLATTQADRAETEANRAEAAVAALPEGTINDAVVSASTVYSSSKVETELDAKADQAITYTKTEVDTALGNKQDTLVSGTNIKTVNGVSVLGSGDLVVGGGIGEFIDTSIAISSDNTALANDDGTNNNNIAIGTNAGKTISTGEAGVFIGNSAGSSVKGIGDIAIGAYSLSNPTAGIYCTGAYNTTVGHVAARSITTGSYNCAFGPQALAQCTTGEFNTAIGVDAGYSLITGSNNTCIGNGANTSATNVSNQITLGNSSVTSLRCNVQTISSLSDERDKTNIEELDAGLAFIDQLNPVRFDWNMRDGGRVGDTDTGFIAQELQAVQEATGITIPNLVNTNNPERLEAAYAALIPAMVKAIQELSNEIKSLKGEA